MARRALILLSLLAIMPAPAAAQSATAQAEAMFRKGRELLAEGKTAEACDAFDASQRLEPAVSTQLNQGNCRAKNGQLATAWGIFVDAARNTRGAKDASTQSLHKVATERAAKLEPRLSTLAVEVPEDSRVAGLEVVVDGRVLDQAVWDQAVPVDGGTHTVTARAPGNVDWSASVEVGVERDVQSIEIPRLKATVLEVEEPPERPTHGRSRRGPLIMGSAALVLGGTAVALALWGDATYDRSLDEPDRDRQLDLWHSAERKRYAAQGVGAVAVGCAGVAVWLYLRSGGSRRGDRAGSAGLDIVPSVDGQRAGLSVLGHF